MVQVPAGPVGGRPVSRCARRVRAVVVLGSLAAQGFRRCGGGWTVRLTLRGTGRTRQRRRRPRPQRQLRRRALRATPVGWRPGRPSPFVDLAVVQSGSACLVVEVARGRGRPSCCRWRRYTEDIMSRQWRRLRALVHDGIPPPFRAGAAAACVSQALAALMRARPGVWYEISGAAARARSQPPGTFQALSSAPIPHDVAVSMRVMRVAAGCPRVETLWRRSITSRKMWTEHFRGTRYLKRRCRAPPVEARGCCR